MFFTVYVVSVSPSLTMMYLCITQYTNGTPLTQATFMLHLIASTERVQ